MQKAEHQEKQLSYGKAVYSITNPPRNLVELQEAAVKKFALNQLFGTKNPQGQYEWITYQKFGERVDNFRAGLASLGIQENDHVGIISKNSVEWAIGCFATYGLLAQWVPMYEKELFSTWKYIIKDSEIKVLLVIDKEICNQVRDFVGSEEFPHLKQIILINEDDTFTKENRITTMKELELNGKQHPVPSHQPDTPDHLACIIYTSGTMGNPKGVMLSHGNIRSSVMAGYHIYPMLNETTVALNILPYAHVYALSGELHNFMMFGGKIAFSESVQTIAQDMSVIHPNFLIAVPRIFNKIYEAVHATMEEEGGIKQKLFEMTKAEAIKCRGKKKSLKLKMLDKIVFGQIRQKFGGKVIGSLTASAVMNREVAEFFNDIGIPTWDCYGLSETSPAISMNSPIPGRTKLGTVGKLVEKTKVIIDKTVVEDGASDGEIIVYGPQVMKGYWKKAEKTAEVMTADGGFRTGDRGKIDEDGFLIITGRIKESFKLENGKYVHPAQLEEDINQLAWVTNVAIYGDTKPYTVALIVPNKELLLKLAEEFELSLNPQDFIKNQGILDLIVKEIRNQLKNKFEFYEIPRKIALILDEFTVENGLLTQTMKIKRAKIETKYKQLIADLYTQEPNSHQKIKL